MVPALDTVDCTRMSSARVPAGEFAGTAPTSNSSETELLALSPTKNLTPLLDDPRPSVPPKFQFATRYSKITFPLVNGVPRVAVRVVSPELPPCPPLDVLLGFHLKLEVSPMLSTPPCVAMPPPDQLSSVPVRFATVLVPKLYVRFRSVPSASENCQSKKFSATTNWVMTKVPDAVPS